MQSIREENPIPMNAGRCGNNRNESGASRVVNSKCQDRFFVVSQIWDLLAGALLISIFLDEYFQFDDVFGLLLPMMAAITTLRGCIGSKWMKYNLYSRRVMILFYAVVAFSGAVLFFIAVAWEIVALVVLHDYNPVDLAEEGTDHEANLEEPLLAATVLQE